MMAAKTKTEALKEMRELAELAEHERINKLLLRALPGGDYLVRRLGELERRLNKLEKENE
ncbi:hypothetical protein LCGC14_2599890 [marine sediment metagenome]|uniref:Uncharacterized protein n=1 Tax=marine sediment metagenome TaxID=412755 RepID=A0A0F9CK07_9ZZZZ